MKDRSIEEGHHSVSYCKGYADAYDILGLKIDKLQAQLEDAEATLQKIRDMQEDDKSYDSWQVIKYFERKEDNAR